MLVRGCALCDCSEVWSLLCVVICMTTVNWRELLTHLSRELTHLLDLVEFSDTGLLDSQASCCIATPRHAFTVFRTASAIVGSRISHRHRIAPPRPATPRHATPLPRAAPRQSTMAVPYRDPGTVLPSDPAEPLLAARRETLFSAREWDQFWTRTLLLVWLMVLQSISGIILEAHSDLLANHPIFVYSITYIVGTGGNAAAQTATLMVRGLATAEIHRGNEGVVILREMLIASAMGGVLGFCGFLRTLVGFGESLASSVAVGICLTVLVVIATLVAALCPLLLDRMGKDPAMSSPIVAVLMDIVGVSVSCTVFTLTFFLLPGITDDNHGGVAGVPK